MACIDLATPRVCSTTTKSELTNTLNGLFNDLSGGLGNLNKKLDKIDTAVGKIGETVEGITTGISTLLEQNIGDFIGSALEGVKTFLMSKMPVLSALKQFDAFSLAAANPVNKLFDAFGCLGSTVKNALGNTIKNMLKNAINKGIVNPLSCAVDQMIGNIVSKISSVMDSILGPLLDPINNLFSIIGRGFGSIKGAISGGINVISKIQGLINCKDDPTSGTCPPQTDYCLNEGSGKPKGDADTQNAIVKSLEQANTWLEEKTENIETYGIFGENKDAEGNVIDPNYGVADSSDCDGGNILDCGLPRIEFFGGGGEGAVGDLILGNFIEEFDSAAAETEFIGADGQTEQVGSIIGEIKKTASIIGVDITYPGEGYTSEPIVSFVDNCDQGYGAYGRAVIGRDPNSPTFGKITDVIIISEGKNYPAGAPVDAFVERIEVENGGTGYTEDDTIDDFEICGIENGKITKVCTNNKAYRIAPSLNIRTNTGKGAILTPVMTRKRRQSEVIQVIDCITPRGNIVGYVNGKEYNGPFHVMPNGQKMTGAVHTESDDIIYNTPQESLRDGSPRGAGSTRVNLRSIQQLVQESETSMTESADTYTDPVDDAMDTDMDTPPPSTPPSTPPSGGSSGGGYGY